MFLCDLNVTANATATATATANAIIISCKHCIIINHKLIINTCKFCQSILSVANVTCLPPCVYKCALYTRTVSPMVY